MSNQNNHRNLAIKIMLGLILAIVSAGLVFFIAKIGKIEKNEDEILKINMNIEDMVEDIHKNTSRTAANAGDNHSLALKLERLCVILEKLED